MKIELTPDAAQWVEAEIAAGHFATADDAIRHAVNAAKLLALRETVEASIARGGANTADEVLAHVKTRLTERTDKPKAS